MHRLLLITNSYPQSGSHEKGFILPELKALSDAGKQVTLMPIQATHQADANLPLGIVIDDSYAKAFVFPAIIGTVFRLLFMAEMWSEIIAKPRQLLNRRFWKESLRLSAGKRVFSRRANDFDLVYTFWFTADTTAAASVMSCPVITRAHGYDIYEELPFNGGHIPFRRKTVERVAKIVTLSRQASGYLISRYGLAPEKMVIIPLGVSDQALAPMPDNDGDLVFLSCSFVSPNKRIGTIGETVAALARRFPHRTVVWYHIGGDATQIGYHGPMPANMTMKALGTMSREAIFAFYRDNRISFFINLSLSEGQPVSVMEAMSFGIPIVATAVGGVPEMLERGGGILVETKEAPDEIAGKIAATMQQPEWREKIGTAARSAQRDNFSAERNAQRLVAFTEGVVMGANHDIRH